MVESPALDIERVLAQVREEAGRDLVRRAYEFALAAHEGDFRASGEPFIQHPLAVADLLAGLHMDAPTLAAGLLHDVVEDTPIPRQEIESRFGPEVAGLVDGVTKLLQINRMGRIGDEPWDERDLESLRKTFIAMARDVRVMLIKLADRLHNMRTLSHLEPARRMRLARETMDIYAPLANRLGVWQWKGELEDLAFQELNPRAYQEIAGELVGRRAAQQATLDQYIGQLQSRLRIEGLRARVTGRAKHIYSIYRKIQRKQVPLERIYDIHAVRAVVDSVSDCYHALGIVHSLWVPIPSEFDDYIAAPKENGYQSLHTAVMTRDGTLEVQIRTQYMHRIAEYGVAAHWLYKEGARHDPDFERSVAALRAQIEARGEDEDAREFVEAITDSMFESRVYAFTPKGKPIILPAGATVLDFAYAVHTEIGHRSRGAKVNGRWVPLDHVVQTGDQVEIVTAKRAVPSRDWLNPDLGYVKTARARAKIKQWFRRQDREQNIATGRTILERELKLLGLAIPHETVAGLFGYDKVEDFLARLGFGDIHVHQIASKITDLRQPEADTGGLPSAPQPAEVPHEVHVMGTGGLLTRLARCCNPLPGEPIIGYITRGRGITVHRRDCPGVLNIRDPERLIEVGWGVEKLTFPVPILVLVYDRPGLIHEITGVISKEGINITYIYQTEKESHMAVYLTIQVTDVGQLSRVLQRIRALPNVIEVQRLAR